MACDEKYWDNLVAMFQELRRQLGDESLPIIVGEISEHIASSHRRDEEHTRAFNRQLRLVLPRIGNCTIVEAAELPLQSDGIHFSSACVNSVIATSKPL